MLALVKKVLGGSAKKAVSFKEAMDLSERYMRHVSNSQVGEARPLFAEILDRDPACFVAWRGEYEARLRRALDQPSREGQRLGIRQLVVECVELFAITKAYFGKEFSDRNREILSARIHPHLVFEDSKSELFTQAVFGEASAVTARGLLAAFFHDAKSND